MRQMDNTSRQFDVILTDYIPTLLWQVSFSDCEDGKNVEFDQMRYAIVSSVI